VTPRPPSSAKPSGGPSSKFKFVSFDTETNTWRVKNGKTAYASEVEAAEAAYVRLKDPSLEDLALLTEYKTVLKTEASAESAKEDEWIDIRAPFYVRAVHTFVPQQEGDLGVTEGQNVLVSKAKKDWYIGDYTDHNNVKRWGMLPKIYVEKVKVDDFQWD
jgi:hypothetical protein